MANKNFLLLSLEDDKIKKVSNVISNESCRKILDYLSDKEATESEIAEKLQIPISTVHYNLSQLMETGLISADEFHYSKKGREMSHYRLANKYIVIAPKKTYGIRDKLKNILLVLSVVSAATLAIGFLQRFFANGPVTKIFSSSKQLLVRETIMIPQAAESAISAQEMSKSAANAIGQAGNEIANMTQSQFINKTTEYLAPPVVTTQTATIPQSFWANIALWFFAGALFALTAHFLWEFFRNRRNIGR